MSHEMSYGEVSIIGQSDQAKFEPMSSRSSFVRIVPAPNCKE